MPSWLNKRLYPVKKEGKLVLSNDPNVDLQVVSSPRFANELRFVKSIELNRSPLQSIEGLRRFKNLVNFSADRSQISSFINFKVLQGISTVSLKETPVSSHQGFKLSLLLVLGDSLKSINGQIVPTNLRKRVSTYPSIAADLIDKGWVAEYPCPSDKIMKQLCNKYGVKYQGASIQTLEEEELNVSGKTDNQPDDHFEDIIFELREKHEEMLVKGQALFGIIDGSLFFDDQDLDTSEKIVSIFESHGLNINASSNEDLLKSVEMLCTSVQKIRCKSDKQSQEE